MASASNWVSNAYTYGLLVKHTTLVARILSGDEAGKLLLNVKATSVRAVVVTDPGMGGTTADTVVVEEGLNFPYGLDVEPP